MTECDVADLVERCLQGDDQAKAVFFSEYVNVVRCAVRRRLAGAPAATLLRSEIEDVCNDVFERLFRDNCQLFRKLRKPASIEAWLVTIAQNYTVDYLRKWSIRHPRTSDSQVSSAADGVRDEGGVYGQSSDQYAMAVEQTDIVRKCVASLTAEERLMVDLFFTHGLKHAEVAGAMGLNINTVSAKLRRTKIKLRRLLEEERYELIG